MSFARVFHLLLFLSGSFFTIASAAAEELSCPGVTSSTEELTAYAYGEACERSCQGQLNEQEENLEKARHSCRLDSRGKPCRPSVGVTTLGELASPKSDEGLEFCTCSREVSVVASCLQEDPTPTETGEEDFVCTTIRDRRILFPAGSYQTFGPTWNELLEARADSWDNSITFSGGGFYGTSYPTLLPWQSPDAYTFALDDIQFGGGFLSTYNWESDRPNPELQSMIAGLGMSWRFREFQIVCVFGLAASPE